jgi:hypothetical protein
VRTRFRRRDGSAALAQGDLVQLPVNPWRILKHKGSVPKGAGPLFLFSTQRARLLARRWVMTGERSIHHRPCRRSGQLSKPRQRFPIPDLNDRKGVDQYAVSTVRVTPQPECSSSCLRKSVPSKDTMLHKSDNRKDAILTARSPLVLLARRPIVECDGLSG